MADIEDLKIDLPERRPRKRRRSSAPAAIAVIAAVAAAAWHFELRDRFFPPPAVKIFVAAKPGESRAAAGDISAGGYLEVKPPGPVIASVLVEGKVKSISAIEGDFVTAGQVIARLDDSLFAQEAKVRKSSVEVARKRLERLEAGFRNEEIAQAEADLSGAKARLARVESECERAESLFASGVVAQRQLDEARAELASAKSEVAVRESEVSIRRRGARKEDVEIARAELAAEIAAYERANWNAAQCAVKAPVSGVILERFAGEGDWISPGYDSESPGAIFSIMKPGSIQAWVDVNQREMQGVFEGQRVAITTDALPDRVVEGRVSAIMPRANLQKNTIQAKIEIPDAPPDFIPDMSVKVIFLKKETGKEETEKTKSAIRIPAQAVAYEAGRQGVMLLIDGRAAFRAVQFEGEEQGMALAVSGLSASDRIILNPSGIKHGQKVAAKE